MFYFPICIVDAMIKSPDVARFNAAHTRGEKPAWWLKLDFSVKRGSVFFFWPSFFSKVAEQQP
jgi:hypothetical protein